MCGDQQIRQKRREAMSLFGIASTLAVVVAIAAHAWLSFQTFAETYPAAAARAGATAAESSESLAQLWGEDWHVDDLKPIMLAPWGSLTIGKVCVSVCVRVCV